MSIVVSDVSYRYLNHQPLFEHVGFSVPANGKVSVIGDNGSGKSTLLKLLAGKLKPTTGTIHCPSQPYYIPQQINAAGLTVSEALGISGKLNALRNICGGSSDPIHYDLLADDWDIESRCRSALDHWGLAAVDVDSPLDSLSGGERIKVFLAGLLVHNPETVLLDEPTNHLDNSARQKLYEYIANCRAAIIVVSHDVTLLNLLNDTYELSGKGIKAYGGNYDFYKEQKEIEERALSRQINAEETALKQARKKAQEARERQDRRVNRADKTTSGIPRIILKGRQDKGENTAAKLSEKHSGIIADNQQKLTELRQRQDRNFKLRIDFEDACLHNGKLLVAAGDVNFGYAEGKRLWQSPVNVEIRSGDRIHIQGDNGSGKTTLIRLLTGELAPTEGMVNGTEFSYIYLDQHYSLTYKDMTIIELAETHNRNNLPDHEVKLRLNRALFPKETWDKNCLTLSGGEHMRLSLCCLMISNHVPDMFILDEPSNNLDLASLTILADTVKNYRGTLLVISHDNRFIEDIGVTKSICLDMNNTKRL